MIKKLKSLGHEPEKTNWGIYQKLNITIYRCTKCNHYFRENFYKNDIVMQTDTEIKMAIGAWSSYYSCTACTCDETVIRDIIE